MDSRMKHVFATTVLLLSGLAAFAQNAPDPRQAVENTPGDIDAAVKQLGLMVQDSFRKDIFTEFDAGRVDRPNQIIDYAATRILALHRMGKLSVHSPEVKSAFTYGFLTALGDETRLHEALALYRRIPAANTDDPFWRIIQARCARMMSLPETPGLYAQVAADMTGVPPSEDVRRIREANRKEFDLPGFTREQWLKQTTNFVYDGKELDVPGSPPIEGSPFPLLDIIGAVGTEAGKWQQALDGSPGEQAVALDEMVAAAAKHPELPWLDGRGFLNTERALAAHLLAKPAAELAALRELQETACQKETANAKKHNPLEMFRRYPWAQSAQRQLLESGKQHLFNGEAQAAFRCFQDVVVHAVETEIREEAQVALWISLSQFAPADAVSRAFDSADPAATWPWNGKREKAAIIRQALAKALPSAALPPSLASLQAHIVRLPPMAVIPGPETVLSLDMQCDGERLLVSGSGMQVLYRAADPGKPLWSQRRRSGEGKPLLVGQDVLTPFGEGDTLAELRGTDGTIASEGNPNSPLTRYRYQTVGGPVSGDQRAYAVQIGQPYPSILGHPENRNWGDVALSCFGNDLKPLWTRSYDAAQRIATPHRKLFNHVLPQISRGAVYFCSNAGHVIRADGRDGEMEWIHFFRPESGDNYSKPPSPWCRGAAPIVTEDKVICMPKFTGSLFALDKETGRRVWSVPLLRGHEILGVHHGLVLVIGANSLYAINLDSGEMRWGRQISDAYADGFQLPGAQLIGSSIYCATKNTLYRFDANGGALLESRAWDMGGEVPMGFHISGTALYVVSDLPLADEVLERRLHDYHTLIYPASESRDLVRPIETQDGSKYIWQDGMLICIKGGKLVWSRFLGNSKIYQSRFTEKGGTLSLSWGNASATHDAATGRLLGMANARPPAAIKIGTK